MAKVYKIYIWKNAPFLRLVVPLIAGIVPEFYFQIKIEYIATGYLALVSAYIFSKILPLVYRFKVRVFPGIIISLFMINTGFFITWNKDIRHHDYWYGNHYDSTAFIIVSISEPPLEKNKSYKAIASVRGIIKRDTFHATKGKILLYFAKDSLISNPAYGDKIIIRKDLSEIKNSGNPAAFNYKRYCAFQQIFHQCYLKKNDWILLKGKDVSLYNQLIFKTRSGVINVLDKYLTGKDETALAKALLIGYKVDLDKDLVQAYSNAGVVHLIAISGLHLGLIYALLLWMTAKISFLKKSKIARLIVILFCLWFFALLTGASASVLRSAVMFSFIATGMTFNKRSSIYNSLASSAFVLLCYDPFMLWDVGFQLSYLAVTGIVISQRYIYNWFYFKNKLLRRGWQLASVSLAAQIFTLPVCLHYFHQMPLLFLLSNLVAIPLATITLISCIILVIISPVHFLALYLGKIITALIWMLNHSVLFINALPFSLWDGISVSIKETILLYLMIIFFLYWLIRKNMTSFKLGLCSAVVFVAMSSFKRWDFSQQKKIIVYNVPAHKAIDFIDGNSFHFVGDTDLVSDGLLKNFHLKPGRISLMVAKEENNIPLFQNNNFYQFYDKRILLIDTGVIYKSSPKKIYVDYIIISKNPKVSIPRLAEVFNCDVYIFDASNPLWKIDKWKKDCEELHLRSHSVPEQGAFVTDF